MRRAWNWLRQAFAPIVILSAFTWSALAIYTARRKEVPPGTKIVLRIGHWQLEAGVRDALNVMAAKYHELHPDVTVVQDPIPEGTYGTWLTTQLMGGTAPDMLEPGQVLHPILVGYFIRYFLPITAAVDRPNPYNAGTEFAGVAWRKTFKDGMRNSYIDETQEFMTVPLSQFGVRVFYNKTLLKKLTGRAAPPHEFREFLALCDQIHLQQNEHGQTYIPIAGSVYHFNLWVELLAAPLTFGAVRQLDFNRDSTVSMDEFYIGLQTGRINFNFPPFAARFQLTRLLAHEFQTGWTGLSRDEAVFLFAQQRAVFITTGTWDAGGLREQAAGEFEVDVMDFPRPTKSDPEFGAVFEGPAYERPAGNFPFVITRTCQHPEVALDFLQFLTSQRGNEQLNHIIGWIPSVSGAKLRPELEAFVPHLEGVYGAMPTSIGGDTAIKWQQLVALFNVEQLDYRNLTETYRAYYDQRAPEEYAELQRNQRRSVGNDDQFVAGVRARALAATGPDAQRWWAQYRSLTATRVLFRNLNALFLDELLTAGPVSNATAPYALSPTALANVRARLAGGKN